VLRGVKAKVCLREETRQAPFRITWDQEGVVISLAAQPSGARSPLIEQHEIVLGAHSAK
jgi:hypothetical protein